MVVAIIVSSLRVAACRLSEGEFNGLDAVFAESFTDAGEEHGFHLFEVEAHCRLSDPEDEMAVFDRDRFAVAGDEISGEFFPCGTHLIFMETVRRADITQDGGDEECRSMDPRVDVRCFIATTPLAQNFLTDSASALMAVHDGGRALLVTIVTDGLDRAAFHRLAALGKFLVGIRLFEDIRVAFVFSAIEVVRCGFAAEVAVDALAIHIEFARYVFRIFVFAVSHGIGKG